MPETASENEKTPAVSISSVPSPREAKKDIPALRPLSSHPSPAAALSSAACDALWQKVLAYFQSIHRLDIFMCFSKSKLILAGENRAVIAAPQPFIVLACNNERYKKIVEEAFLKCYGKRLIPRAVLMGSHEEAEAKAEAANGEIAAPTPPETTEEPPAEGYERISITDIPESDLANPALAAALKITGDCDIYEKKSI